MSTGDIYFFVVPHVYSIDSYSRHVNQPRFPLEEAVTRALMGYLLK